MAKDDDTNTAPDLTKAESFSHWATVSLRFSDQDSLGHINNVAIAAYIEQGRVALIDGLMRERGGDIDYILASVNIDYRRELHFPGSIDVGGRLVRIGNKSITTGYGVFKDGECVATAGSVNVFFDPKSGKTIPIPDDLREVLEGVLAKD